jgi:hypothetical protein
MTIWTFLGRQYKENPAGCNRAKITAAGRKDGEQWEK